MASGCPCLVADTGGARVVPNMAERLRTDGQLRDRLVAEASEHVLSFDGDDVARQVGAVYEELPRPVSLRSG